MKLSYIRLVVAAVVAIGVAAACSSESSPSPDPTQVPAPRDQPPPGASPTPPSVAPQPPVTSEIKDFTLGDLTIPVGTTVTWVNRDSTRHTTTSGSQANRTNLWDSGIFREGETFSFTFDEQGVFPYFCVIHFTSMNATVTVTGESAGGARLADTGASSGGPEPVQASVGEHTRDRRAHAPASRGATRRQIVGRSNAAGG